MPQTILCSSCPVKAALELSHSPLPQIAFWWHKSVFHSEPWLGNPDVQLASDRRQEKKIWEKEIPGSTTGSEKNCQAGTFVDHKLRLEHSKELPAKLLCSRPTCQTILPPNLRLAGAASLPAMCLQDAQGPCSTMKDALSHQEAV